MLDGHSLFIGRREVKPSIDGWHIRKAFWKLSSKVRPIAMTCNAHLRTCIFKKELIYIEFETELEMECFLEKTLEQNI